MLRKVKGKGPRTSRTTQSKLSKSAVSRMLQTFPGARGSYQNSDRKTTNLDRQPTRSQPEVTYDLHSGQKLFHSRAPSAHTQTQTPTDAI